MTQDERAEPDLVKGVSLNAYEDSSSHGHQEGCEAGHHESNEGHKESHNIFMMGSQLSPLLVGAKEDRGGKVILPFVVGYGRVGYLCVYFITSCFVCLFVYVGVHFYGGHHHDHGGD